MKEIININLFWYICILIPFSFIIGIAVTELFVFITILFFLYKNRDASYYKDKKFILIIFSIYIFFNALCSNIASRFKINNHFFILGLVFFSHLSFLF